MDNRDALLWYFSSSTPHCLLPVFELPELFSRKGGPLFDCQGWTYNKNLRSRPISEPRFISRLHLQIFTSHWMSSFLSSLQSSRFASIGCSYKVWPKIDHSNCQFNLHPKIEHSNAVIRYQLKRLCPYWSVYYGAFVWKLLCNRGSLWFRGTDVRSNDCLISWDVLECML